MSDELCPYIYDYELEDIELTEETVYPCDIVSCDRILSPFMLLEPNKTAVSLGSGCFAADFGRECVGDLYITLAGSEAEIDILYSETYDGLFADSHFELPYYVYPRDRFVAVSEPQEFQSSGRRAFRFIKVTIKGLSETKISGLYVKHRHYPVIPSGSFICETDRINTYYKIAGETTKLCMQRFYEDGVKRDGLLWIGDLRVQLICNYYLFGDSTLAAESLKRIAKCQFADGSLPSCAVYGGGHQHPDYIDYMPRVTSGIKNWVLLNYCTDYISAVYEYLMFTGDKSLPLLLWACLERLCEYLSGMLGQSGVSVDLSKVITDENLQVKDTWRAVEGTFLMQLYEGFLSMYKLSIELNKPNRERFLHLSEVVKKHILTHFDAYPLFTDNADDPDRLSLHTNAFAILTGIAEESRYSLLVKALNENPQADYPIAGFMHYYVIAGLMEAGAFKEAWDLSDRFWGTMVEHNAVTCWEKLDYQRMQNVLENPVGSNCHGWSAGIAPLLGRYILGVTPLTPGFETVRIHPAYGQFSTLQGSIPTPHGVIYIRIGEGSINIRLPQRVKAALTLPDKQEYIFSGEAVFHYR